MAAVNNVTFGPILVYPLCTFSEKSLFYPKTTKFARFCSNSGRFFRFYRFVDNYVKRRGSLMKRRDFLIIGKTIDGEKKAEEETEKQDKEKEKQKHEDCREEEKTKKIGNNSDYGNGTELSCFHEEKAKDSDEFNFFKVPEILGFLNLGFLEKKEEEVKDKPVVNLNLGRILLLGVAILWGLNGVIVKYIYSQPGPPRPIIIVFLRKFLSVAFFLSLLIWQRPSEAETDKSVPKVEGEREGEGQGEGGGKWEGEREKWYTNRAVWLAGGEIGLWTFSGAICQTLGLEYTSATRGGFELQVKSILVPLMASFSGDEISGTTWTAAILALCGIIILGISTLPETSKTLNDAVDFCDVTTPADVANLDIDVANFPPDVASFSSDVANVSAICTEKICPSEPSFGFLGDIGVLSAAFFYALTTFRLGTHAKKFPVVQLATTNMTVALILSTVFMAVDSQLIMSNGGVLESVWESWRESNVVFAVGFSGLICGGVATLMQTTGQKVVAPPEAQVLYSLQPVWAAFFASILLEEKITPLGYFGGGVVLFATLLTTKNVKK